jgi:hypothetical protein
VTAVGGSGRGEVPGRNRPARIIAQPISFFIPLMTMSA